MYNAESSVFLHENMYVYMCYIIAMFTTFGGGMR